MSQRRSLDAHYMEQSGSEERYNVSFPHLDPRSSFRVTSAKSPLRSSTIATLPQSPKDSAVRSPIEYAQRLQGIKRSSDSRRAHLQHLKASTHTSGETSGTGALHLNTSNNSNNSPRGAAAHRRAVAEARDTYVRQRYAEEPRSNAAPLPHMTLHPGSVAARLVHTYSYLHSRYATPLSDQLPVVYADPLENASVGTGLSQQELLRQKARSETKKKRFQKRKKPKEGRILNVPSVWTGNSSSSGGHASPSHAKYVRRDDDSSDFYNPRSTVPTQSLRQARDQEIHDNEVRVLVGIITCQ
jgi:hypothetical protein